MAVRSLFAPWPGKAGRRLTVLGSTAAAEYAAAVGAVALVVELALGADVHGGRVADFDPLAIEPWPTARGRHRRLALDAAPGNPVALRLDVTDCYRSIAPEVVARCLHLTGAHPEAISRVCRFLGRTAAAGIPGLPVGPDPSVVLANAVLHRLDMAVGEGVRCLRWYDDLLLLAPTYEGVLRAERRLGDAASGLGLRLHPGKRRLAIGPAAVRRLIVAGGAISPLP